MEWLENQVSGARYETVMQDAVKQLYPNKPTETRKWTDELPRGAIRDAALVAESTAMMDGTERSQSLERANQIDDEALREEQRKKLIKRWKKYDPYLEIPEN